MRKSLRTGDFGPDILILFHQPKKASEFGALDRLCDVGATHVVDDHLRLNRREEIPSFGEIGRLEIDDDVPAERRNLFDDSVVVPVGFGINQAANVLKRTARTPLSCISSNSRALASGVIAATPRQRPFAASSASSIAELSVP